MKKFIAPSIEVKNFSRVSILTASETMATNMAAAKNVLANITVGGTTASINESSIAEAAMR